MTHRYQDEMPAQTGLNRRQFLRAASLTAVAATAAGAGAAAFSKTPAAPPAISVVPSAAATAVPLLESAGENAAQLLAQLAAAQAENRRLQATLTATQQQMQQMQGQADAADSAAEPLLLELQAANAQVGLLAGLVALYEQLDDVTLAEVWDAGVTAVSEAVDDLLEETPALGVGVAAGRQALLALENQLPALHDGRLWLSDHLDRLQALYARVQALLAAAVETAGSVLEMLNHWFADVLDWLPFGLGQKAAAIMQAIADVLAEMPQTMSGLDLNVRQPLDTWLAADDPADAPLRRELIGPLRDGVLTPADAVIGKADTLQKAYREQLATPLQSAVANRQQLRAQIDAYRQQHGV